MTPRSTRAVRPSVLVGLVSAWLVVSLPPLAPAQVLDPATIPPPAQSGWKHPKISGPVLEGAASVREGREVSAGARALGVRVDARGIQVFLFLLDYREDYRAQLAGMGVSVEIVEPSLKMIQARVPAPLLESVAQLPFVRWIEAPTRPSADTGSRLSEGDALIRANSVRSTFGLTGAGIRVGVIQFGFVGIQASQASGDVPAVVPFTTRADGSFVGTDPEGTALLEVVHDVAPGAQLFPVSFQTMLEQIQAVNWLTDVAGGPNARRGTPGGADIIVDDIPWYNVGLYDGSSPISQALTAAVDRGVVYVKSVGNRAQQHWRGAFTDANGNTMHEFAPGDETLNIIVPRDPDPLKNITFCAHLQWNDPWTGSANDYDLLLYDRSDLRFLGPADGWAGPIGRRGRSRHRRVSAIRSGLRATSIWLSSSRMSGAAQRRSSSSYSSPRAPWSSRSTSCRRGACRTQATPPRSSRSALSTGGRR